MKHIFKISWIILFIWACEENPVGESSVAIPNQRISGNVSFDRSNVNSDGVFVWFEGLNRSTYTDSEGRFEFLVPPTSAQANSKGATGSFNLYYYLANFKLASSRVYMRGGNFIYSQGEFNSDGELSQEKVLFQKLKVTTNVRPTSANNRNISVTSGQTNFILRVDVTLQAVKESVIVFFPGIVQKKYGPLMFRNVETNEIKVLSSTIAGFVTAPYDTIDTIPMTRTMVVPIFPEELGLGRFEVIPFLHVEDKDLPTAIKLELELDQTGPGQEYLRIPYLRSGANRFFTLQ